MSQTKSCESGVTLKNITVKPDSITDDEHSPNQLEDPGPLVSLWVRPWFADLWAMPDTQKVTEIPLTMHVKFIKIFTILFDGMNLAVIERCIVDLSDNQIGLILTPSICSTFKFYSAVV